MTIYDLLRQEINDAFAALQAIERHTDINSIQAIVARGYWWGLERAAAIMKTNKVETANADNINANQNGGKENEIAC